MKNATNFFATVDNLGRIVIPKPLRKSYELESGTSIELFPTEDTIVIRKYTPGCTFCNSISNLISHEGKLICEDCIEELENKLSEKNEEDPAE